jgi:ankyrin repeat protein
MDGHDEVAKFLLDKGAKVDIVNIKGRTTLMEAALWGRSAVV